MGMKQFFYFFEKKNQNQNCRLKKKRPFLGLVKLIDAKGIDVAQPLWL